MSNKNFIDRGMLFIGCVFIVLLIIGNLSAQNDFFPRGVYSGMVTDLVDSLDQMQRAGFNVVRAGMNVTPYENILIEAGYRGLRVSFSGGNYVHNYSGAQYNIYEAEVEQGDVPHSEYLDWFYWYAHETGREYDTQDRWYANPGEHAPGYMLRGVYYAHENPDTVGLWHEQMIGENGRDFEAAYYLRMGSGTKGEEFIPPVVNLEVRIYHSSNPDDYTVAVDSTLTTVDFTIGVWDTFRVYYHLTSSDSEKYVLHNLYWHGLREIWVDWVEVKDTYYGVPLFAGTVDNDIINEANTYNAIPSAGTLWRWYLWDEPSMIQYRAQNYVDQLLTTQTAEQVPGMTAFHEGRHLKPYRSYNEYMYMVNPEQLVFDYNTNAMNNAVKHRKIY